MQHVLQQKETAPREGAPTNLPSSNEELNNKYLYLLLYCEKAVMLLRLIAFNSVKSEKSVRKPFLTGYISLTPSSV